MKIERCRLVFSGSGGQGVITASIILAEAAALYDNLNAVQTQVYGAAARGGSTRADVIISNAEINFPKVLQPNVLVCLTQESYNKFYPIIRPGGILLTDARYVKLNRKVDARQKSLPMYQNVMDQIGKPIVFNICMLGAVIALTKLVKPDSVMQTLSTRIPPGFLDLNRQALELGMSLGEQA